MTEYKLSVDRKKGIFVVDPEKLTTKEKMEILNLIISELEIVGEDTLKANIMTKTLREKFKVRISSEKEQIVSIINDLIV